jgi:hypothetical protein
MKKLLISLFMIFLVSCEANSIEVIDPNVELPLGDSVTYSLTYHLPHIGRTQELRYQPGELLVTQNLVREGFVLRGWYLDEALTIHFDYEVMPNRDLNLYPKWSKSNINQTPAEGEEENPETEENDIKEPFVPIIQSQPSVEVGQGYFTHDYMLIYTELFSSSVQFNFYEEVVHQVTNDYNEFISSDAKVKLLLFPHDENRIGSLSSLDYGIDIQPGEIIGFDDEDGTRILMFRFLSDAKFTFHTARGNIATFLGRTSLSRLNRLVEDTEYQIALEISKSNRKSLSTESDDLSKLSNKVQNPDVCKIIEEPKHWLNEVHVPATIGFSVAPMRLDSFQNQNGLVVFVNILNSPSEYDYQQMMEIANEPTDYADAFYRHHSFGNTGINWTFHEEIIEIEFSNNPTNVEEVYNQLLPIQQKVLNKISPDYIDDEFDFVVFFGAPDVQSPYQIGPAFPMIENPLKFNNSSIYNSTFIVLEMYRDNFVLSHELGHLYGWSDIYVHGQVLAEKGLTGYPNNYMYGSWDIMSDNYNEDLSTWHKWMMGWIQDDEVRCTHKNLKNDLFLLQPPTFDEDIPKMIVIPISQWEAIFIESRYYNDYCKKGCEGDILVTYIDTRLGNGNGTKQIIRPERATDLQHRDSMIRVGENVTIKGYTIMHQEKLQQGSIISISGSNR